MENIITYVAMDTHKKEHKIALHWAELTILEGSVLWTENINVGSGSAMLS